MKHFLLCVLAVVALAETASPQSLPDLIIHDVTVIDATGAPPQPHRTVIVRDGKITEITDSGAGTSGKVPGVRVNGTGKFLIPGLWDMHVHMVFGDWFPRGKEVTLPLFIANGVTGVRDM